MFNSNNSFTLPFRIRNAQITSAKKPKLKIINFQNDRYLILFLKTNYIYKNVQKYDYVRALKICLSCAKCAHIYTSIFGSEYMNIHE